MAFVENIKREVDEALEQNHIFVGGYPQIKKSLLERGWYEKYRPKNYPKDYRLPEKEPSLTEIFNALPLKSHSITETEHRELCEKLVRMQLLDKHTGNFYWQSHFNDAWLTTIPASTIVNFFASTRVTTKWGLCAVMQRMHWHNHPGVAETQSPRSYNTAHSDQFDAFLEDYRLSACMSLLKVFLQNIEQGGVYCVRSPAGTLHITMIQYAIDRCNEYSARTLHHDIDWSHNPVKASSWDRFLKTFYLFVYKKNKFIQHRDVNMSALQANAKQALVTIAKRWPQYELDGMMNIWIVKPPNSSQGRGIRLMNNLHDMVSQLDPLSSNGYIVQKYIERPFLIYNTKFDIRQWLLVTSIQPLTLWIYKECYLRFSSQLFDLMNFDTSIHLTNNAVQKKLKNCVRCPALPDSNMWSLAEFRAYLKKIGFTGTWEQQIYPCMKRALIGVMLASQDTMGYRENSFGLYGADFLIGEDFTPYLLEINALPQMHYTTPLMSQLCPQCLEDLIKVVIDRPNDLSISTGQFELIHEQPFPTFIPPSSTVDLLVEGKGVVKPKKKMDTNYYLSLLKGENVELESMDLKPSEEPDDAPIAESTTPVDPPPKVAIMEQEMFETPSVSDTELRPFKKSPPPSVPKKLAQFLHNKSAIHNYACDDTTKLFWPEKKPAHLNFIQFAETKRMRPWKLTNTRHNTMTARANKLLKSDGKVRSNGWSLAQVGSITSLQPVVSLHRTSALVNIGKRLTGMTRSTQLLVDDFLHVGGPPIECLYRMPLKGSARKTLGSRDRDYANIVRFLQHKFEARTVHTMYHWFKTPNLNTNLVQLSKHYPPPTDTHVLKNND